MDSSLKGRVAVVMAASQGLGRAAARALARAGADVAVCARRPEVIADLARELEEAYGVEALAVAADVTDRPALEGFIRAAGERFGGIDVLVTNAGGPPAGRFVDLDDEAWARAVDLNLMSVVRAVRAALPFMRGRPGANVMCVVSSSVKAPIPRLVLSNTLRPGIVGLAKTLSLELAADGIRVNCLAPGRIDTERVRHLDAVHAEARGATQEEVRRASEASIPAGRYGEPEEFADVAAFLASDGARYVTGQTIFVDGGLVKTLF